jgi:hypothetical protein
MNQTLVNKHPVTDKTLAEVEEFPLDAPDDQKEEVLAARLLVRGREKYGSIILSILLGVMVQLIVHWIVEWWKKHHSHQVLMEGWQYAAKNPGLPPPPKAA